jgi:hypothetical protein
MDLTVSASMDLDQLAQHMGDSATIEQARAMRDLLVDDHLGVDVGDIIEGVWLALLDEACEIALLDEACELVEQVGVEVEYHQSHELLIGHWDTEEKQDHVDLAEIWWATFFEAVQGDERLADVRFRSARGNRRILSQWIGYQFWQWSSHNLGCRGELTADQEVAIDQAESAALEVAKTYWRNVILRDRRGHAKRTSHVTAHGEAVYDLDPQASELWVVAGPAGIDPASIDPDDLPDGCRWVNGDEWEQMVGEDNDGGPTEADLRGEVRHDYQ